MKRIIHFAKRRKYLTAGIILAVIIVFVIAARNGGEPALETVVANRGAVTQEVTVTGKTQAVTDISLAFEKTGRVSRVPVKIGDQVTAGQVLVELDKTELAAQLAEAQANVQAQQASLAALRRGSRPEDIQLAQTELKQAEQNLANEYQSVFDVLNDAYVKAEDAVRKQVDDLFTNDEEINPQLTFAVLDSQKEIDAEFKRRKASDGLKNWKDTLDNLLSHGTEQNLIDQDMQAVKTHLLVIRDFLNTLMSAVVDNANLSDSTETTYKAAVTTARTNVATAQTNVSAQEQTIAAQRVAVARANDALSLTLAGSTPEDIAAQEAKLKQAEASTQLIRAQIAKSTLRSPIVGVVTKQDAKVGQLAQMNVVLVSVISASKLEIEADVPEADVAKIAVGNNARITFDAYAGETFSGRVAFIDPAETVIEGVPTYRTVIELADIDPRIKPGLTADVEILAGEREHVIIIPQRSLIYRDDKKFVRIVSGEGTLFTEREVTTGLRGSDGMIEITSGLTEGEQIVRSPE